MGEFLPISDINIINANWSLEHFPLSAKVPVFVKSWSILNTSQLPKWIDNTRKNYQIDRPLVLGIPWRQITQGLLLSKMVCVMLKFLSSINADTALSDIITKKKTEGFQHKITIPHLTSSTIVIRVLSLNLTSNKNSKDRRLASGRSMVMVI